MRPEEVEKALCERYGELLSAYIDDELSSTELVDLAGHLKICIGCAREMDKLMAVKTAIHSAEPFWPKPIPSPQFVASVLGSVAGSKIYPPPKRKRSPFGISKAASFIAAAVVTTSLVAGGVVYLRDPGRQGSTEEAGRRPTQEVYTAAVEVRPALEEYIREHAMESSANPLIDYDNYVEFVNVGYESR